MLRGKAKLLLEFLEERPRTPKEIYAYLGAETEAQRANARKLLRKLKEKGLIVKEWTGLYALTEKGKKVLECLKLLEE